MIICDKFSYNHCEEVFDFKNKLHNYIRNKECQQSFIKSKSVNKTDLTSLSISETIFNNFVMTFIFVIKSITSHKFNLLTFIFIENIALKVTIISIFIFVVKSIGSYKFNLSTFISIEISTLFIITRIVIVFLIMFM